MAGSASRWGSQFHQYEYEYVLKILLTDVQADFDDMSSWEFLFKGLDLQDSVNYGAVRDGSKTIWRLSFFSKYNGIAGHEDLALRTRVLTALICNYA
ncbi:hypothetical protein LguiA_025772 [Lonicera macranthoides]